MESAEIIVLMWQVPTSPFSLRKLIGSIMFVSDEGAFSRQIFFLSKHAKGNLISILDLALMLSNVFFGLLLSVSEME